MAARYHVNVQTAAADRGTAAGNPVTLFRFGPFTVKGLCFRTTQPGVNGGTSTTSTMAETVIATSSGGSSISGNVGNGGGARSFSPASGDLTLDSTSAAPDANGGPSGQFAYAQGVYFSAVSGDGRNAYSESGGAEGVRLQGDAGPACTFHGSILDES